jgi:hypothetical protein
MKPFALHRAHLIVSGVVLAFLLAIALATFTLIWQQRLAALHSGQAQGLRFVDGAVAALNRSLLDLDVLLAGLDESLNLRQQHRESIDPVAASGLLHGLVQRNLILRRMALLDSQLQVLAWSQASAAPGTLDLPANFAARAGRANSGPRHQQFGAGAHPFKPGGLSGTPTQGGRRQPFAGGG